MSSHVCAGHPARILFLLDRPRFQKESRDVLSASTRPAGSVNSSIRRSSGRISQTDAQERVLPGTVGAPGARRRRRRDGEIDEIIGGDWAAALTWVSRAD